MGVTISDMKRASRHLMDAAAGTNKWINKRDEQDALPEAAQQVVDQYRAQNPGERVSAKKAAKALFQSASDAWQTAAGAGSDGRYLSRAEVESLPGAQGVLATMIYEIALATTRTGRVMDAIADEAKSLPVELKMLADPTQLDQLKAILGVDGKKPYVRHQYIFDTPNLKLLSAGIVMRARSRKDSKDTSTVKVRPLMPADVQGDWSAVSGFKHENDVVRSGNKTSASLRYEMPEGHVDDALGDGDVAALFSDEQLAFLRAHTDLDFDLDELSAMGPVVSRKWEVKDALSGHDVDLETWTFPDGRTLLELSVPAKAAKAEDANEALQAFANLHGLREDVQQTTKTRQAIAYFQSHATGQTP